MTPKVTDSAPITTPANSVWRTCTACGRFKPQPEGVDRCESCTEPEPPTVAEAHALAGWNAAQQYAALVGQIEAWAEIIPGASDAERLDHIRHALQALHPFPRNRGGVVRYP